MRRSLRFFVLCKTYARPTGKHLVIWTRRGRLTINQVEDWKKKPREAEFRSNYGMSNTPYLFLYMNDEEKAKKDRKHLLLLHGYQDLNFCYVTVPAAQHNLHLANSGNLLSAPHIVTRDPDKEEGPSDSPDPEALDHLRRIIRDTSDE